MAQDLQKIQDQINAQMHWDASEEEIAGWLRYKYGIEGEKADDMIQKGIVSRKAEIRKTSLVRMIASLAVAIPLAVFTVIGFQTEGRMGARSVIVGTACLACLGYAGKNLMQFISGKSNTAIDA